MTNNGSDWRREQLRRTLEHWRATNFDPHVVLGIPHGASQYQIINAHRRWVAAYHPDLHNSDPLATELTQNLNAARDTLLAAHASDDRQYREQARRQAEARRQSETDARQQRRDREHRQRRQTGAKYGPPQGTASHRRKAAGSGNSFSWAVLALSFAALIIAYPILTVTAPDAIDYLMEEWARIFDQALAR